MRWAALALVLLLAGCGVRPTGVVGAGEPAIGVGRGPLLYFVSDGALHPVTRDAGQLGSLASALTMLAGGPTPAERAAGLTTELSADVFAVTGPTDGTVTVQLGGPSVPSPLAVDQVVCTVIGTSARGGADPHGSRVRLAGAVFAPSLARTGPLIH